MATDQQLLDIFSPKFWSALTLAQMFKTSQMIPLVNTDFSNEVATRGDTVNTRMPGKLTAVDHQSGVFNSANPDADNVQIKLDKWKETPAIKIDDKVASMSIKDLTEMFIQPAAEAIVEVVETDLVALYKDAYTYIGTAGTPPASVAALGTNITQRFDDSLISKQNRRVMFNSLAANNFRQNFWQVNQTGQTDVLVRGMLPTLFGHDNYDSQYMPKHTTSPAWVGGTGAQVNANTSPSTGGLNSQTLAIKGLGTGQLNRGDIFTLDHGNGLVQSYTILEDATITANVATAKIAPVLAASVTANQVLTVVAAHAVNLAFHRDAITLASRPLAMPKVNGGAQIAVSNYGGLGIRSTIWYEPKDRATYAQMDILYGVKTLDARKMFRILG